MYLVKKATANEYDDFLSLPSRIHNKNELMQKRSEELTLLQGTHTLSKYFSFTAFVCYFNEKAVARCAVTIYPNKDEAYLGFFDSEDNSTAVKAMVDVAENFARENGIKKLIGPVDASFWIGYRMKSDKFDENRYFSEPYGKEYYPRLWKKIGFEISETYVSNIYKRFSKKEEHDPTYIKRYNFFIRKGYHIVSPKKQDWNKAIGDVYKLLIKLYSDFPVFSYITEEEFRELYKSLKLILDFSMVKFVYKNDTMVGFFITVPDYRNKLYGKLGLFELIFMLKNRKRCDNYILLYLGVDEKHLGLGSALSQAMFEELCHKNASAIGALIKKGKVSEKYLDNKIIGQREYLLFE
ncbi:MAG: hypothetical protein UE295_07800, partial [Acutalibacteraceae bacterium]|nr:hypothetical protein [Acutalibacteraceae bacterium]